MRLLQLTHDRFEMMYEGMLATPRGFTAPSETRIAGKVLDKLEAIGHQTEVNGVKTYRLDGEVITPDLELSDEEWALAIEALKAVKWMGGGARKATDLFDMLEKAPVK